MGTRINPKTKKNDHYRIPVRGHKFKSKKITVGGRLHKFRRAWKGAAFESIVRDGLSWSWIQAPPELKEFQQQTSPALDGKMKKLLHLKVIEKSKKKKKKFPPQKVKKKPKKKKKKKKK